jgi:serine/threonine-protein kinase RsbW
MKPKSTNFSRALSVKAETAQLATVRDFVEKVAVDVALDTERVFDLKVAVSEACANAVEHAGGGEAQLEIGAYANAESLTFVVTDRGSFHTPSLPRQGHPNRGLGLPLMVALMDEVRFARLPTGGTTVSLSVLL